MYYSHIKEPLNKVNIEILTKAGFLEDDLITLTLKSEDISSRAKSYGLSEAYITKIRKESTEPLDSESQSENMENYLVYVELHRKDNSRKANSSKERIDLYLRRVELNNGENYTPDMFKALAKENIKTTNRVYARDLESRLITLIS